MVSRSVKNVNHISMPDYKAKAEQISKKMNAVTQTLMSNIKVSEDMQLTGNDVIELVEETTKDVPLYSSDNQASLTDLINLQNLLEDFKYIRDTLRENTDNGRKILNLSTVSVLDGANVDLGEELSEAEYQTNLIQAFATLNHSITESLKLYITAYKEISNIIINLEKVKTSQLSDKTVNNTLVVNNPKEEIISTKDLLKQLQSLKKEN